MNSKWHLYISILKSIIRIGSVIIAIILNNWILLAIGLVIAEILGIAEDLNDDR